MEPTPNSVGYAHDGAAQAAETTEALSALRRFARTRPAAERCELCSSEIGGDHPHLLDGKTRQLTCACDGCAVLFCGQEGAKFLRVPRRTLKLEGFRFTDIEWEGLMLPINLAFFVRQPNGATSVLYPSPAGVMESLIEMPTWDELFAGYSPLLVLQPEVEVLLVNRIGEARAYYIAPIDAAYRLVGVIRTKWHGLSGGPEMWTQIAGFFASLERRATPVGEAAHA